MAIALLMCPVQDILINIEEEVVQTGSLPGQETAAQAVEKALDSKEESSGDMERGTDQESGRQKSNGPQVSTCNIPISRSCTMKMLRHGHCKHEC